LAINSILLILVREDFVFELTEEIPLI